MFRSYPTVLLSLILWGGTPLLLAEAEPSLPAQGIEAEWHNQTPDGEGYWKNGVWVDLSPQENESGFWQNGVWVITEPNQSASGYFDPTESQPED